MPELPEVETVKRILEAKLVNKTITGVECFRAKNIASDLDEFLSLVPGKKILSLTRKGKYLLFHLSDEYVILGHLRMEGKFFLKEESAPYGKFDLIVLHLDDGKKLVYQDVRKFGGMGLYKEENILRDSALNHLGKEPFEWEDEAFYGELRKRHAPIKEVIMDQALISGIGNIYADESLFASHIHPRTPADSLNQNEVSSLLGNARRIMQEAIDLGGSTVHSYHPSEGVNGGMQNELIAYGRKDAPCPNCGFPFRKSVVGGRGTTYCPICQKNKAMPFLLLLTGPIHTGKSFARSYFVERGYLPMDADEIVKELYLGKTVLEKAKEILGKSALKRNRFDKEAVLKIFTKNPKKLQEWEAYIHPLVRKEIEKRLKKIGPDKKVCLECQLPFQSKIDLLADAILLIVAEKKSQEQRLLAEGRDARRLLSLNAKYPLATAKEKASFVINNDGTIEEFEAKLKELPLP